jgi:hypothetical protein
MAPSWALSTLNLQPNLTWPKKRSVKNRWQSFSQQTTPLPIGTAGLGESIFDHFPVRFAHVLPKVVFVP